MSPCGACVFFPDFGPLTYKKAVQSLYIVDVQEHSAHEEDRMFQVFVCTAFSLLSHLLLPLIPIPLWHIEEALSGKKAWQ